MARFDLDAELTALDNMSSRALRDRWQRLTDSPTPKVSPKLLRLALAFELQAAAHGGLQRRIGQRLEQIANGKTRTSDVRSGMRLVREWNGIVHVVTIDEAKRIHWNGTQWASLSEVARAITGTRWSGPAFFGLKQKGRAA